MKSLLAVVFGLFGLLWTVGWVWRGLWVLFNAYETGALACFVKAAIPGVILWFLIKAEKAKKRRMTDNFASQAGVQTDSRFIHWEDQSGIAVKPETKQVCLSVGKKLKTYAYKDIRGWKVNQASGGAVVPMAGGMANSVAAVAMSAGADARNNAISGLFLQVRDIDNPEWRVAMSNRAMQNRWFEILTQEINEGGISAS